MKIFKAVFYALYFTVIVLVLILSFNMVEALELFKEWGWFRYFSDLPILGRNLLIFLCVMMISELLVENLDLKYGKKKLRESAHEIKDLEN